MVWVDAVQVRYGADTLFGPSRMTNKTDINSSVRVILDGPNSVSAPDLTWTASPHNIPMAPGNTLSPPPYWYTMNLPPTKYIPPTTPFYNLTTQYIRGYQAGVNWLGPSVYQLGPGLASADPDHPSCASDTTNTNAIPGTPTAHSHQHPPTVDAIIRGNPGEGGDKGTRYYLGTTTLTPPVLLQSQVHLP